MDFRVGPTCWRVAAALHFLSLQVRGHVVVREEHGLQLAHSRQGWICKVETKQESIFKFFLKKKLISQDLSPQSGSVT